MPTERIRRFQCPNVLSLAGFQLITIGRFWVITEVLEERIGIGSRKIAQKRL
jgi:hypothetical protein